MPFLEDIHRSTSLQVSALIKYYQVDAEAIPEHTLAKVNSILQAKDVNEASELAKKAIESGRMYCLGMWSQKKAKGPRTKAFVTKQAKREDAFAARMKEKEFNAAAKKHKKLAKELWLEVSKMN